MEYEQHHEHVVDFPLRGRGWVAVTSPADRVPSHGTDMLGQRYAIDLLKVDDRRGIRYHPASTLRALVVGVPTKQCYAWGQAVHSPMDGEVLRAVDGSREPAWVHPVSGLLRIVRNGLTFRPGRLPAVLGNHVILRSADDTYAAFVHLAPESVRVTAGQTVRTGDVLGCVGHTGNSTAPHLHFQLMDSPDPLEAKGVSFSFREYDVLTDGRWRRVAGGVPKRGERVRSVERDGR